MKNKPPCGNRKQKEREGKNMYVGGTIFIIGFSILIYYLINDNDDNDGFGNIAF